MKEVLQNLLKLQPQNLVFGVYAGAVVVWLVLVAISFSSVLGLNSRPWVKVFWMFIILSLPLVGLAAYCLYAALKLDWGYFLGFLTLRRGGGGPTGGAGQQGGRALSGKTSADRRSGKSSPKSSFNLA